ncbi:MAG: alpha/beta hydrolase [Acidimicrobiales bacterium]
MPGALFALAPVALVASLVAGPGVIPGQAAVSVAPPIEIGVARFLSDRSTTIAPTTTTLRPDGRPSLGPTLVADARPGDLRIDPEADALPVGYVAEPADEVIRDISYGPDDAHRMDLYLPDATNAPVVVYLHHGGWTGGDRGDVPDMVLRFVERGYAVASVGYRLAPEHPFPAPMHDVKRAIRELKVFGDETGLIDGDALVLYGISAGGQLAAFAAATVGEFEPEGLTAAQAARDSSVAGIVVVVGPTDLVELYDHPHGWARPMTGAHAGCDPCTGEQLALASPITHVHADMAPAYWAYGGLDPLVDAAAQGRLIAEAWAEAAGGDASWLDVVENESHVLDETMVNQRSLEAFVDLAAGRR